MYVQWKRPQDVSFPLRFPHNGIAKPWLAFVCATYLESCYHEVDVSPSSDGRSLFFLVVSTIRRDLHLMENIVYV